MKIKWPGEAVGHGLGNIQARILGKRRRIRGVCRASVRGVSGKLAARAARYEMLLAKARAAKGRA